MIAEISYNTFHIVSELILWYFTMKHFFKPRQPPLIWTFYLKAFSVKFFFENFQYYCNDDIHF